MRSSISILMSSFAPFATSLQEYVDDRPIRGHAKKESSLEVLQWKMENQILQSELSLAKRWIYQEKEREKRAKELEKRFQKEASYLIAKVIYRVPSSWSHSFWIDVGQEDNSSKNQVVSRGSPVVDGNCLIGVIDYVGPKQSKVRLITDPGLNPSVRVERGKESEKELLFLIDSLAYRLEENKEALFLIEELRKKIDLPKDEIFLAKGELRGSFSPFWQKRPILKGYGFNYNHKDVYGAAKDLRDNILKEGDHLITSGLDGLFPFGLSVAVVKKVKPLTEGSFAYEIDAVPTASALSDLRYVFVLPLNGE